MPNDTVGYTAVPYPRLRGLMVDGGRLARQKHVIHGLFEVDVTEPRELIRQHKEHTGETLSFTAFIIACLAEAIDANRYMHAYRNWRNQLILFDEVDVNMLFEVEVDSKRLLRPHIIRAANKKTFREIHDEIRAFQAGHAESRESSFIRWFVLLPGFVRRMFLKYISLNPHLFKEYSGTVIMTSVGMFGTGGGWGIPAPNHTLQVTLGGIATKPLVVNGCIVAREALSITVSIDHDIVDGAPATRFAKRFQESIASADLLCRR